MEIILTINRNNKRFYSHLSQGACSMDNSGTCPTIRICAHKHQIIRSENVGNNFVINVPTSDYIVQATI